jgi:serine protease inhibitor ecotin
LINMAFTMACPNFKKGLKTVSGHLGVKISLQHQKFLPSTYRISKQQTLLSLCVDSPIPMLEGFKV